MFLTLFYMVDAMSALNSSMGGAVFGDTLMLMQSIMFARAFAVILIIVGLGVLLNRRLYLVMMEDASKGQNPLLLFVTGFFTLVLGWLMVMSHNFWRGDWTVLVTLMCWLTFLKGVLIVLFPQLSNSIAKSYKAMPAFASVAGLVILVLGVVFAYFGYFLR